MARGTEAAGLGLEVGTVRAVTHQGVADMSEMDPDLVGAPGLELAFEQRRDRLAVAPAKTFPHFPMRDRLAPAFAHRHFFAGVRRCRLGTPQTKAK